MSDLPVPAGPFPESAFTAPRPDCPHPQRWHAHDAEATELEVTVLVAAMVTALQPDLVVETGTYHGHTAAAIGAALAANGHGHLHSIELDAAHAELAREAVAGLPVTVHTGSSLEWTPPGPVDLAWFDSHPDLRVAELRRYLPHMHQRTVVGFHDTGPQHVVARQVEIAVADGLVGEPLWLPTPRGVAWARVL